MNNQDQPIIYKGFSIVAKYYRQEFRAAARHKHANKIEVRNALSVDDALSKVKILIDDEIEKNIESIKKNIIASHKQVMDDLGKSYKGVGSIQFFRRTNHCYKCKKPVDNAYDLVCNACNWIICSNCGSCGCGYNGPIF